jgi:hypothetical protein
MITAKAVMSVALVAILILITVALIKRSRLITSRLDLDDLLIGEDGKLSKAAAVMMGAFALTSWVIIYMTLNDKLTEGYFLAYIGVWATPTVTKLIVNRPLVKGA